MKEFVEKLMERLENRIKYNELCHKEFPNTKMSFTYEVQINAYKNAIEIVNQLAEEYKQCIKSSCSNCETYDKEKHYCPKWCDVIKGTVAEMDENRWIPCSERLPEQKNARVDDLEFRTSEFLWVTTVDGEVKQATYETDKWYSYEGILIDKNVVAWQPLYVPQPYIPKE